MKKIFLIFIAVLLVSCSGNSPVEKKKQKLVNYKEQVVKLNLKIKQLEKEIGTDTTAVRSRLIPVKTEVMKPGDFNHFIEVSGMVKPEQEAFITPEISGYIKHIYVKEGDRVKTGDLLFKLNSSITESSISEAKTQLNLAKVLYDKQKELWDQKIGSEVQYLQTKTNYEAARQRLNTLQAQLDMASIRAPFNGIIDQVLVEEGSLATPGRQLALLMDLKKMKITAFVSEQYLNDVHAGNPAMVTFPDIDNKEYQLKIFRTGKLINEKSRDFQIECKLDNPDELIRPNQFALIRLNDFHSDNAITVPSSIIKQDLNGYFLYKVDKQNGATVTVKTYVKPGMFYNNRTLIQEGLSKGDRVIVEGYNQVSSGEEIRVID